MTGIERLQAILAGEQPDRLPVLPIVHAGLAPIFGVPLGRFFTDADEMAGVLVQGWRRFGWDGIHASMGVTGEAEALGASVEQPENGAPILREHLLSDLSRLGQLESIDPTSGGRMPLFFSAVTEAVRLTEGQAFVMANLRGPLLTASQLRGVEQILVDSIEAPEDASRILDFAADLTLKLGSWLLGSGAHGLVLGEATCSPNFISPALYRDVVLPKHRWLVKALKDAGWPCVGLHICGNTTPIIEDVISTGVDFLDIDYQVAARHAIELSGNRIALRGNLDPASTIRFGTPDQIRAETSRLLAEAQGCRWIVSSGCDIPPGTPEENLATFAETAVA